MDAGMQVTSSSDNQVTCESQMNMTQSVLTQMAIGNSYSTTPRQFVQVSLAQIGEDVRTQATSWVETQMAFGQVNRMQTDQSNKQKNDLQRFLFGAGGVPADSAVVSDQKYLMGFMSFDWNDTTAETYDGDFGGRPHGVYISEVTPGLPAELSGLQVCDRLVSIDRQRVSSTEAIPASTSAKRRVVVDRNGEELELTIVPELTQTTSSYGDMREAGEAAAKLSARLVATNCGVASSPMDASIVHSDLEGGSSE